MAREGMIETFIDNILTYYISRLTDTHKHTHTPKGILTHVDTVINRYMFTNMQSFRHAQAYTHKPGLYMRQHKQRTSKQNNQSGLLKCDLNNRLMV